MLTTTVSRRVDQMRASDSVWTRSLWNVVLAIAAIGLTASSAAAQATVHLIAAPVTKNVTLPNGDVVSVPMWGYALDKEHNIGTPDAPIIEPPNGVLDADEPVTVPGPRIVVPVGSTSLVVTLTNLLPEATSLVIPGQPFAATPERNADGRVRSMTPETGAGLTSTYTFNALKPGTFLYQSGSHPAVQVQMGLYGAMTMDASAGNAYAGVAYAHEAVLVYSEIDQALHEAVNTGTYGTPFGPTSTLHYRPSLFLINGESYTSGSMAAIAAGTKGEVTLLRILNAGLRTHAPALDNGSLRIVAEDGNLLPFAKDQAAVMLAAGKTHDALWTPAASGVYSLYDRMLGLNAPGQGAAGMLAKLRIGAAAGDPSPAVVANPDFFTVAEDGTIPSAAGNNVLSNDANAVSAELVAYPHAGTLTLMAAGTFTYTPNSHFFGVDEFTYRALNGVDASAPALVTITVTAVPNAPVANAQTVGVDQGGNVVVKLSATDADGDPLKYYLASLPGNGALSFINPLTKVETPIVAGDLHTTLGTGKAIPAGLVIYTPTAAPVAYVGPDAFNFVASDGGLDSAPAAVSATVYAAENAVAAELTTPVTLTVRGADSSTISNYRWTLEEDLTYKVIPGVHDPNTLAVSFHKSYMPVVASGTEADVQSGNLKVNPAKRYFISVLPTENTYSNSGAEIEVGQTVVTVTASKLPLPTARIRVRVFQDNAPLDGMWSSTESGLPGFQVTIDDAGGTYGMSGGHQSTDAFGNKIGTIYQECTDAAGNPAPGTCDSYQVARLGDGFVLSDFDGYAVIENLVMGKYTVKVRAPGGEKWIQTTTIEGQPGVDAWVKPNEPQFFTEFGPPGPHVFVGFTRAQTGAGLLGQGPGPFSTITGRVTNLRLSRPVAVAQFSGAPFTHTRAWVALNTGATGGSLLYAQPTNEDGTFSIAGVPSGTFQLVVFDSALDLIIAARVVNVTAPDAQALGDVAVFPWFTNLYSFVFEDENGDGIHQAGEAGIPDQALNIRFRDGSIYQSLSTDDRGFKAFNETFPFGAWMIAEVDYTRYHSTGLTVVVDNGGDASALGSNAYNWQTQAGLPAGLIPPETLNPQPQPDNGNLPFRTESGAGTPFLLLEGFQGFIGQSTVMMWGKAPYAPPGSIPEDIDYDPVGVFEPNAASTVPCPADAPAGACVNGFLHDIDGDNNGVFDADHFNGGLAGILHYGITRAENDPRWAVAENWDPGISDVKVQLWDATRAHLLNEGTTDNFNRPELQPAGCQWPGNVPYNYLGRVTDCFDGLRNFNQARPAAFDGGYAFSSILVDNYDPLHPDAPMTFNNPISCEGVPVPCTPRQAMRPIPAGKYVVKVIVPPGYKLQKEEDKNVDFGDTYVPRQFWLSGYPLANGGVTALTTLAAGVTSSATTITVAAGGGKSIHPNDQITIDAEIMRVTTVVGDVIGVLRGQAGRTKATHTVGADVVDFGSQLAPTVNDNALVAPFCVGKLHLVPEEFSLFPGVPAPFGGEMRPLCDAKLVTLRDGQQAAPDFHFFTEAPVAGHVHGIVLDDTTNETDPNAPTFGEKYAPPFLGVAIRDWQGREITRTYTDQYGLFNVLVPTTYTINPPEPSGVSPSILAACINPPTMPGPGGTVVADPHFQKQYSHFCYPLQYLPGKTTYLDTPVVPTGAFTGTGTLPVDAEFPNHTPVIASVTGPNPVANPPAPDPAAPYGPYIVDRGAADSAARTIVITSQANMTAEGLTEVANPAFDGTGANPKLIKRDYGFGTGGTMRLAGQPLMVTNWTNKAITAIVPTGLRTGELSVEAGETSCTVSTTPLSTLNGGISDTVLSLSVATGDGKKFAIGGQIQVDGEVMLVTGGNRSTLGAALANSTSNNANTFNTLTLRVPVGAGTIFTTPATVSVENEVIRLNSKSATALAAILTTANILGASNMSVTANTGFSGSSEAFTTGDYLTIGSEVVRVLGAGLFLPGSSSYSVARAQLGTTLASHPSGSSVTANDRFSVTRAFNGTTRAAHASGLPVIGDVLTVARAQDGTTAAAHSTGATVASYTKTCVTINLHKSILGVTLSVATPTMHSSRPPKTVAPGQSIQAAIDTANPGDLILVQPGTYEEMVVMSKPVRLQGAGAPSTVINVVTTPAENLQAWLDKMGGLLTTPSAYVLPNQPAMTPAPFQSGDVAAVVGAEGPGVMVLSKNQLSAGVGGTPLVNAATSLLGPLGTCLTTRVFTVLNFGAPANAAYCLQNENYTANMSTAATWRPNARIDGLSLIGASNASGVQVNGYARYLEISNNKINTNSGPYAGGINVGHAGAVVTFANQDAQNDQVAIHNNMIAQNASVESGGGGGVVLGTGSNGYVVKNNFIAANLSAGHGGGISHVGLSPNGTIDGNTVIFNESFTQALATNGGGIFIGGTPAAAGALTAGSGTVEVTNNLIQGNAASGGDGGGVALLGVNGTDITQFPGILQVLRYRVRLYNNVIANNVAGLAGGGISIADAAYVDITHNTIVHNDSTGTALGAFSGPLTSTPQPAGVVVRGFTWGTILTGSPVANVMIANSIVRENRTFRFGPQSPLPYCGDTVPPGTPPCSIVPPPPPPPGPGTPPTTQYGEIQIAARPYWDLAVLGATASQQFSATSLRSSVLTSLSGPSNSANYVAGTNDVSYNGSSGNSTTGPVFVASYFNGDRKQAATDLFSLIATPAALDEGGNFIRPQFGPLSLEDFKGGPGPFFGNYHLTSGENGAALGTLYGNLQSVPGALLTDFDQQARPTGAPDRGADESIAPVPTTPVPQR